MSDEEVIEVTVDIAELKKLKVAELKRKLAELGLDNKGTKAELIARVEKYLTEQEEVDEDLLEEEEGEEEEGEGSEEVIDELVSEEDKMAAVTDATASSAASGGGKEGEGEKIEQEQLKDTITPKPGSSGCVPAAKGSGGIVGGAAPPTTSTEGQESTTTTAASVETKVSLSGLSGAERLARRAARFGENTSIDAKKMARAERFGTTLENGVYKGLGKRPMSNEDMERLRKRGERFGTSVSPAIAKVDDEDRKKKRIEKFGLSATELSEEDRKKKRAEKFGT